MASVWLPCLRSPSGLAVDNSGTVYVADHGNNVIRKISPGGWVTTLAGRPSLGAFTFPPAGSYADGTGTNATFVYPSNLTLDAAGNLYVVDSFGRVIRKITPEGVVTTVAGLSSLGSVIASVSSLAVDNAGNIYVADAYNNTISIGTPAVWLQTWQRPQSLILPVGSNAVFSVTATGMQPLQYQWFSNGTAIVSATNASFALSNPTSATASYYVVVTNNLGGMTSAPVALTVASSFFQPPPPQTQSGIPDTGFTLSLGLETGRAFRVQGSTDMQRWQDLTNFTSSSMALQFIDAAATNFSRRFYRVVSP